MYSSFQLFGAIMGQIILLNSYIGLSDFAFEVTSSGRQLTREEIIAKDLLTNDMQRRHKESSYKHVWYEVGPGDTFTVTHISDDVRHRTVLKVPNDGMKSPNVSVDNWDATGMQLEQHLTSQCELISQEDI